MKLNYIFLSLILLLLINISCNKEEVDNRKLIERPIYPEEEPDALNSALIILGNLVDGDMPSASNPDKVNITITVSSALITNDNYLFLPFAFDTENEVKGIYLQIDGANNYWNASLELVNSDDNSLAIAIGIPPNIQDGVFKLSYKIYDTDNNVSNTETIDVSIVPSENKCGSGQGFQRVTGEDGITVKTYDLGDVPGTVNIYYYMYTKKDRMDIRYNNKWVANTSSNLLIDGQAPPIKTCDEATPEDGFVSGGGSFSIQYDPNISREMSVYVSGCLQGGTLWYFDVFCPQNSTLPGDVICGKPSAQVTYDVTDPGYHIYPAEGKNLENIICDPNIDPNCTVSAVFETMLKQSNFIAPTNDKSPVIDCKVTWVNILVDPTNPIVSKVNPSDFSVVNYTLENEPSPLGFNLDHFLHPGKVTRKVKIKDSKVVVCTEGEGIGLLPSWNVYLSTGVWNRVDKKLKDYWDNN